MSSSNGNLTAADLAMFTRLGIGPELLAQARVGRVTDTEARTMFGIKWPGDVSGIAFPYFPPVNNGHSTDHRWMVRIRRDHPEMKDGKPEAKYISEHGIYYKHLYWVPGTGDQVSDPAVPIVLVESEKAALALVAWADRSGQSILPVAMGGAYGWLGKRGRDDKGPSIDLDYCNARNVILMLDSNASSNQAVRRARMRLAQELVNRECMVRIADLPQSPGLNGPDDAIALCGDQLIADVMRNARPFSELARTQIESEICRLTEKMGRVDPEDLDHYFELLAAVPDDEERELFITRLHKAMRAAITKATIKDAVSRLRLEYGSAKAKIKEQARQADLKNTAIDVAQLVTDLEKYFSQRAYLPDGAALALAYWSMNTWTFALFDTTPYLDIESAIPGCGKTTIISLLRICREAQVATLLTEATMFRIIGSLRPTLLIDEAEFIEGKSERAELIRAMSHAGYKTGARVPRCKDKEQDHDVEWFDVYCPKLFAVIGGITGALLERSIVIHMEKKPRGTQLKSCRERVLERDAKPLRRQLEAYALQVQAELTLLYDREPDEGYWPHLETREAEIWGPLLIHARLAGPEAETQLLAACVLLSRQKTDIQEQEYDRALALELYEAVNQHQEERFAPSDLTGYLNGSENWGAKLSKYKEDDAKSKSSAVGRFLRKFRLKSKEKRRAGTSYLRSEALCVLGAHITPSDICHMFHTATPSTLPHAPANSLISFTCDVEHSVADARKKGSDLPQEPDDDEIDLVTEYLI